MKKFINTIFYLLIFLLFATCGNNWSNFKKTMSGQKVTNTDEFLIKKKDPLILPPEYEKLPLPNSKKSKSNNSSVQNALSTLKKSNKDKNVSSNLENEILKELRK